MRQSDIGAGAQALAPALRRVLCIAYFYPPSGGAGVQRPLKFTKYLPSFGWQPYVLSVSSGCFFAEDASLVEEIAPLCHVERTWSLELERLAPLRRYRRQQSAGASLPRALPSAASQKLGNLLIWGRAQLLPDSQVGWVPFAWQRALQMCRTHHIDAVWTTSAPYSGHLVGLLLKKHLGLPWIADFRDAWSDNPMGISAHRGVHRWLEKCVLQSADRVVGVTQDIVTYLEQRSTGPKNKYHVIANGYDPDDFDKLSAPLARGPQAPSFVLTMTGSLYGRISAVPFYEGLACFFEAHPAARAQTQVRWVGQMDRQARIDHHDAITCFRLGDCVRDVGYVSHKAAIEEMLAADALLLLLFAGAGAGQVMTGKIFEYLAADRPILAMAEGTAAAKLVAACQAGIVTHPQDRSGIAAALGQLWQRRSTPWPKALQRQAHLDRFSRRALTGQLAQLLDGVIAP